MFMIDIVLKNTPSILSVQRKESEDAEAIYNEVTNAVKNGGSGFMELTCEKDAGKRVTFALSEVVAVQMADRSGSSPSGRAPGFFALTAGE